MPMVIFVVAAAVAVGGAAAYFINDTLGDKNKDKKEERDASERDGQDDAKGWDFLFGKKKE